MKNSTYYLVFIGILLLSSCTYFKGGNKTTCDYKNVTFNTGYDRLNSTVFQPLFLPHGQKDLKWQIKESSINGNVTHGIIDNQGLINISALPNTKWITSPFEYRGFHEYIFSFCLSENESWIEPDIMHFDVIGLIYDINNTSGLKENSQIGGVKEVRFNNNIIYIPSGGSPQNSIGFDIAKSQINIGINELRVTIGTASRPVLPGTMMSISGNLKTIKCCSD